MLSTLRELRRLDKAEAAPEALLCSVLVFVWTLPEFSDVPFQPDLMSSSPSSSPRGTNHAATVIRPLLGLAFSTMSISVDSTESSFDRSTSIASESRISVAADAAPDEYTAVTAPSGCNEDAYALGSR